jgi:hypothetical protein
MNMHPNFEKILKFTQSTGDKLVITDVEGNEPIVVMPLASYAELVGFSDLKRSISDELLERKAKSDGMDEEDSIDALSKMPDEFFAPTEPVQDELALEENDTSKSPFQLPSDTKAEVVAKKPPILAEKTENDSLIQEEQFYLEPIE